MKKTMIAVTIALLPLAAAAQHQHQHQHQEHGHSVDRRGDDAMGFPHQKSRHTFRLYTDGGLIAATTGDAATREQIRVHMREIAKLFAAGEFDKPRFIHGRVPPGVETMKARLAKIDWKYVELERGAGVRITTKDAKALAAVHAFLAFQIDDHRTGDSTEIVDAPPAT